MRCTFENALFVWKIIWLYKHDSQEATTGVSVKQSKEVFGEVGNKGILSLLGKGKRYHGPL
jgi:hypothetical protein